MGKDEVGLDRLCSITIKLKVWCAVVSCKTAVTFQVLIEIIINRNPPKCFRILTILEFLSDKDKISRICIMSSYVLRMGNLSGAWIVFHRHELLHHLNLT